MRCGGEKFRTIANWRLNSWIISQKVKHLVPNGLLFMLITNSTFIKKIKKKSLLITNINHNLGDSAAEGQSLSPHVIFNIDRIK